VRRARGHGQERLARANPRDIQASEQPLGGGLVGAAEADPRKGKISNESPIGKAILNHRPGDVVTVEAPGGSFQVKILKTT